MCIAFASLVPLSMYVRAHVQARTAEFPENIAHAVELSVASLQEVLTRTKTYVSLSLILSPPSPHTYAHAYVSRRILYAIRTD